MHRQQQSLSAGTAASCSLFFFFFFKSLCLPLPFSLPLPGPICLSSSFISSSSASLSHFPFLFFSFPPERSFSPLLLLFPLCVLSLLSAPEAMWSRRGSRVTEAGPFGVASSLSRLRGDAVHVRRVFACERGAVLEGKARCERMMHLIHCEERRKKK